MAVQLFKPGNTHVFREIPCEMCVFPEDQLEYQLSQGWQTDWTTLYDDPSDPFEDMTNDDIRGIAHIQNIDNWATARIETLKRKITDAIQS